MSYDAKCHALAAAFLSDAPKTYSEAVKADLAEELAQVIQTAIEDFMQEHGL